MKLKDYSKRIAKEDYPIILIDWDDATTHPFQWPWMCIREVTKAVAISPFPCHSIGYLVKQNEVSITIAQTWSPGSNGDRKDGVNFFTIPSGCIKRMREVKV